VSFGEEIFPEIKGDVAIRDRLENVIRGIAGDHGLTPSSVRGGIRRLAPEDEILQEDGRFLIEQDPDHFHFMVAHRLAGRVKVVGKKGQILDENLGVLP
jgi:hypothetical protein